MFTWNGGNGSFTDEANWTGVADTTDATVYQINSGIVDLSCAYLDGVEVWAAGSSGASSLMLTHTVIASNSRILTLGTHAEGNVLDTYGTNWNYGNITLNLNPPGGHDPNPDQGNDNVYIADDPTHPLRAAELINYGTISSEYGAISRIIGTTPGATLTNNGVIEGGKLTIDTDVLGTGTISFFSPYLLFTAPAPAPLVVSTIELDRRVGAGQTIDMTNDGTLALRDPQDFEATIKAFTGPTPVGAQTSQDALDFLGLNVTSTSYAGDATHGTLTVNAGSDVVCQIRFAGDYTQSKFTITHDTQGHSHVQLA